MVLSQKQTFLWVNKIESTKIYPCLQGQLIHAKGTKNRHWGKDNFLNIWLWENWMALFKIIKLDHFLIPYTQINSKWIKESNVRPEIIKLPEENINSTLFHSSQTNAF